MDPITSIDLGRILIGEQPMIYWIEIMFRVLVVYLIALVFLRAGGKNSRKQLTPMSMLLVVALGSIVGDTMFTPGLSILYVILIISVVTALQYLVNMLAIRSGKANMILNSRANLVVEHGMIMEGALCDELLSKEELYSELRLNGIRDLGEVEYAFLEISGSVSVFKYKNENDIKELKNILPLQDISHIAV